MVHDGEIVRRQIPDDVHVVLEQSQVHAQRIVVVQIPELAIIHHLADLLDCSGKQERVIHHNLQILAVCQLNQFFRLLRTAGERLLHENVFAIFQSSFRQLVVRPHWSHNRNQVDVRRFQDVIRVLGEFNRGVRFVEPLLAFAALVTNQNHFRSIMRVKIADNVRSPIPVSNHTNPDHKAP